MQIRVKLFVLNENAAKHLHLHLDPCQSACRHIGSTPRKIYSVKISDPNKRDAKDKTDDRKGTVFSCLVATEPHWPPISSTLPGGGGGGALPYLGYTGTCRWIGYGFLASLS